MYSTGVVYHIPINDNDIKIIEGEEYIKVKGLLDRLVIDKRWTNVMKESAVKKIKSKAPKPVKKPKVSRKYGGVKINEEVMTI